MAIQKLYKLHHDDPREWKGDNKLCELCDQEALIYDDFCEDHQSCECCDSHEDCETWCENKKDYEKK